MENTYINIICRFIYLETEIKYFYRWDELETKVKYFHTGSFFKYLLATYIHNIYLSAINLLSYFSNN